MRIIILVIILSCGLILYRAIEGLPKEEDILRRLIYSGKRAIEKEDLWKCISYISFDYADKYGNDRSSLALVTKSIFEGYDQITIKIFTLDIEVSGQEALAAFEVIVYARRADTLEQRPLEYDRVKCKMRFKKEERDWKAVELELLDPENDLLLPSMA